MSIRVAHVCPVMPALRGNGLAMRAGVFSQAASGLGEAYVLVVNARNAVRQQLEFAGAAVAVLDCEQRQDTRLRIVLQVQPGDLRAKAHLDYGRPVDSIALSAPVINDVVSELVGFRPDLILVSRAYMLPVVQSLPADLEDIPVVVDLDDDDATLKRDLARHESALGDDARAAFSLAEAGIYDHLITAAAARVSLFTCANPLACQDIADRLGLQHVACIPNAAPDPEADFVRAGDRDELLFVGSLGYEPNVDGLRWFAEEVWPKVSERRPSAHVTVAGAEPGQAVTAICLQRGFRLVANPESLGPLYRRAAAAIVPLRFGSGSRIKILEAGALGVPVITTRKGAEGLELDENAEAFVSDETANDFAAACIACLTDEVQARARAAALKRRVEVNHLRRRIVGGLSQQLLDVVSGTLKARSRRQI